MRLASLRASDSFAFLGFGHRRRRRRRRATTVKSFRCSPLSLSTERSGDAPSIARSRPTPAGKVSPRDKFGVEEEALHCARVFAAKVRAVGREVADRDGHNAVVMRRVTYHSLLARREEHARRTMMMMVS